MGGAPHFVESKKVLQTLDYDWFVKKRVVIVN